MKHTNIHENIRRMRLSSKLTQEELAEKLNVSPQTVSKWENGASCPDITMLPTLAEIFRASVDELLGYDRKAREIEIEKLSKAAWKCRCQNDMEGANKILREGLMRFPGDEVLLNCLLYSMEEQNERIRLATTLSETTMDDTIRFDALRILAEEYSTLGNEEMARLAVEKLPEIYFTKMTVGAETLKGQDGKKICADAKISLHRVADRHDRAVGAA